MKLRSLLEHEAGAPPPAWAAAGTTGLAESDSAVSGAPLWELSLLSAHYHPHLSQAAAAVAHIPPQGEPWLCCSQSQCLTRSVVGMRDLWLQVCQVKSLGLNG